MCEVSEADLIAWWGAGLSTLLAARELLKSRLHINIGRRLDGDPYEGNTIIIRNLGSETVIVEDCDLFYASGRWPLWKLEYIQSPYFYPSDLEIQPKSSHELEYKGQYYFSWGESRLKGRRIFIKLRIAGHRWPKYKYVYG